MVLSLFENVLLFYYLYFNFKIFIYFINLIGSVADPGSMSTVVMYNVAATGRAIPKIEPCEGVPRNSWMVPPPPRLPQPPTPNIQQTSGQTQSPSAQQQQTHSTHVQQAHCKTFIYFILFYV